MPTPKQVLDFRPSKGITTAQSNEHQRRWTDKGWDSAAAAGNYDRTRAHLNFEIRSGKVCPIDQTRTIPERMASILAARGIKDPNAGLTEPKFRTVVNFIFGGSRDSMNQLAFGDQPLNLAHGADNSHLHRCPDIEEWAKDVYRFVADKYGEENIVAFIVHLDETNPHVHCTLLPIQNGRFAYKQIFAGKDKYEFSARMKALHSDFAEVNKRWGMERGTSVAESGARHRTTEEYRRQLSEQCTTIEQSITAHQRTLASLQSDIRLAERRVKGLTSMVNNLLREKADKEAALTALHRQILDGHADPAALQAQVQQLENDLAAIQSKLDDKQAKLAEADRQADLLREVGRHRTAAHYVQALNSLMRYRDGRDLPFDMVTPQFTLAYESWLRNQHLCRNTTSFYMRILRTIYNKSVVEGLTTDCQPFLPVYTGIDKTAKRAITKDDIHRIKHADLAHRPTLDFARDMFLLSFYLRGIAPIDLAFLRKSDISQGTIYYTRSKTGQQMQVRIEPDIQRLLDKYADTQTRYLLPLIKKEDGTEQQQYRNSTQGINRHLKQLSAVLHLSTPLTLYVARHSWASIAQATHVPTHVISGAMGHDSEVTTQIYLASIQTSQIDEANSMIIDSL